ncbi:mechanosensitive ion channel family protein [Porphyrobacter sp. GA68]|uniref:mechanosensitive ion channel family protein n=1 Tax=Porphyrobacter sp. GA68 TaxID=2883480 RepID=UPI001D19716E|nr:mechanosensitive ion channel domain-containing protein [Porphyrobacter sp. GA68]
MSAPIPPSADIATAEAQPLQQQAWNLAERAPEEAVAASDGIREAVSARSQTVGSIVDRLDSWAVSFGSTTISLWDAIIVLIIIVAVFLAATILVRVGQKLLRRMTRLDNAQELLAEKLVAIMVWGAAFFIGIELLGINLTALAVFSGAFGLAIGFGLQKTFGNLIAGIILLMDKSIKPGDVIAVADTTGNETFGQIRKIGIRAVSITTRDQREYLIPNENLMINQVENWSYSSRNVRMQVPVGVSYKADLKIAEKLMLEAASKVERILKTPPPTVWMNGYGDNSVDFVIQCWISDPEEGIGNVRSAVLKNLWWLFQEHGIEIPFPQRDINIRSSEELEQLIASVAQRLHGSGKHGEA